jgi:hypothetical protein
MEIRQIIKVHRSMVFLLMRTLVSFFFVLCGFFVHLPFIFVFSQKQDTTQEYKKISCLSVTDFLL